jgi:CRP-like cAMP-binding protein
MSLSNISQIGTMYFDRADRGGNAIENSILQHLPECEFSLLQPHLELVSLSQRLRLQGPDRRIEYGYFINHGLISILVTTDSRSVEVGVLGREGFVGIELALGFVSTPHTLIVQVPGNSFRIGAGILQQLLPSLPDLRLQLNRFVHLQGLQVAQLAACNRLHELEQRLARWLLMSYDRTGVSNLPFTHDLLAAMLGTARPSVTLAAGILQREGAISYERGVVTIVDRPRLERAACECYSVIANITNGNSLRMMESSRAGEPATLTPQP